MSSEEYLKVRNTIVNRLVILNTSRYKEFYNDFWNTFTAYLNELGEQGWTRGHLLNLLLDLDNNKYNLGKIPLNGVDYYITVLIGHSNPYILKPFLGEPEDKDAFLDYIHSRSWQVPFLDVWGNDG